MYAHFEKLLSTPPDDPSSLLAGSRRKELKIAISVTLAFVNNLPPFLSVRLPEVYDDLSRQAVRPRNKQQTLC